MSKRIENKQQNLVVGNISMPLSGSYVAQVINGMSHAAKLQHAVSVSAHHSGIGESPGAPAITRPIRPLFGEPWLELLRLLHAAAEIEHALLVQYLHYSFLCAAQAPKLEIKFIELSRAKMSRFAALCRMLREAGARPSFLRRSFPLERDLTPLYRIGGPLASDALEKLASAEASAPAAGGSGNTIGQLYAYALALVTFLRAQPASPHPGSARLADWETGIREIIEQGSAYKTLLNELASELGKRKRFRPTIKAAPSEFTEAFDRAKPALQLLIHMANRYYWLVLSLLCWESRFHPPTSPPSNRHWSYSAALSVMIGPIARMGRHLSIEAHRTMSFDQLPFGYAWAENEADIRLYVRHLATEIDDVFQINNATLTPIIGDTSGIRDVLAHTHSNAAGGSA